MLFPDFVIVSPKIIIGLERLAKAKIILPPDNFFSDDSDINYGVPWL